MKINRRALHYSGALGALNVLSDNVGYNTRRYTRCKSLIEAAEFISLGEINEWDVEAGKKIFEVVQDHLMLIAKEENIPTDALLVTLIIFHLEELAPLNDKIIYRIANLLDCWPESTSYETTRVAHRLWQRMETEIEIWEVSQ